jgi:RNA polymerase sigma-70 factor (ECF subfamily)
MHAVARQPDDTTENAAARADDLRLVEQFRAGDRRAFGELVRKWQRPLYGLLWRIVRNEADARDLVQTTFLRAWTGAEGWRGESSFRTWVYRIGVNLALNHKRDRGRWLSAAVTPDELATEATGLRRLVEAETSQRMGQAVETLPARQRLVVELRVYEGLSFREVAEVVGSSEDAAKANFHHAIKRLRDILAEGGEA